MNLLELKPKHSKLKLKAIKQELILNPVTLADEAWMEEQYGAKQIAEIFEQVNIKEISRIVFRLLDNDSKRVFKKQTVEVIDENGDSHDVELGGLDLLRASIIGWQEKIALLNALLDNIGISRPDINEELKKKNIVEKETMEMPL